MTDRKPIPNYPGYEADTNGTIWSCWETQSLGYRYGIFKVQTKNWHILKPNKIYRNGHLHSTAICLVKDKMKKTFKVGRLIAQLFIENPDSKLQVNHKDGNPDNNNVDNLYWGTQAENLADAVRHGTHPGLKNRGEASPNAKLKDSDIPLIWELLINSKMPRRRIGELFNVRRQIIDDIANKETWKHLAPTT